MLEQTQPAQTQTKPGTNFCPKLRTDLVAGRREGDGNEGVVLKDPAAGRFFRFGKTEGFILEQMDGATPLDEVCRRTEQRFDCELSGETLQQFTERIRQLGLLEDASQERLRDRRGRIRGDLFYLRLKAFDPDRLLDRLAVRLRFCFTPAFVASSTGLVILGIGLMIMHWQEITLQFRDLLQPQSLMVAWMIVVAVIAMHEFAHGVTCKHFGGRVHEMGIMLIFFQPAFYCNVSDAWLFPRKSHRLWVTFAGAYFEMVVWAIAMVVWRLTEPYAALNRFALIVAATSVIKSFFNMNPLIKLDGYYLLSDWLDIPNLRSKSSAYLRAGFRALLGRPANWPSVCDSRERRICLVYGLIATAFTIWMLTSIALHVGGHLTAKYQGWGFVVFTALVAGVFRSPIRKALSGPGSTTQSAQPSNPRWRKLAKATALFAVVMAILYWVRMDLRISGEVVILPAHNADVRAEVEGIIEEVFVEEGDVVKEGQLIARLSPRDYQAELRKTVAAIEEKTAQLRLLEAGPRAEEITLARTSVSKGEERLKFERRRLEMDRELFEAKLLSRRELEVTEELTTVREKELNEASENLRMLLAGNRPEEIEAVAAEVRRLEVERKHLEDQLRLLDVTSPVEGVVTTRKPKEIVGQRAAKGDLIIKVHEVDTVMAEISVSEKDIGLVQAGQAVMLKCRAYPQHTFRGTVAAIAPIVTKPEDRQTERFVNVTTRIRNEPSLLKPEMTGNAKISTGKRRLLELVSRRLTRYVRVEFWSWW